jgi:phosphoglycolate phosphatase-like HAD superfamily hydrolase
MTIEMANSSKGDFPDLLKAERFDFDGVILESAEIKTEAFLELFADYPQHQEAILRYHLDNVGISRYRKFDWIFSELLGRPLDDLQSKKLGEAFSKITFDKIVNCPFVPGAIELLETLHGVTDCFVVSGTPHDELASVVECRGLAPYFKEVWGSPQQKTDIIRSILERHDLGRNEVLFVGDGISDYRAAKEAGVPFFARKRNGMSMVWDELGVVGGYDLKPIATLFPGAMASDA